MTRNDLWKCHGVDCDQRHLCERFTSNPVDGQRWGTPSMRAPRECFDFNPNESGRVRLDGERA